MLRTARVPGHQTLQQRYQAAHPQKAPEPTSRETRIGIAQMFETQQILEDIYYLILKNVEEEVCFEQHWSTCPPDGIAVIGLLGLIILGYVENVALAVLPERCAAAASFSHTDALCLFRPLCYTYNRERTT